MQAEDHRSGNRMHHVQRCLRDGFWRAADEQTSDTLPNATLLSSKPPANYFGFDPNRQCKWRASMHNQSRLLWRGKDRRCARLLMDPWTGSFHNVFADSAAPVHVHILGDSTAEQLRSALMQPTESERQAR